MSISPENLKKLRKRSGLTQTEAAHLVRSKLRTWQSWEADSKLPTSRKIPDGLVELFCMKVGITYPPK
ncbi:MAG: transcriptional regulator [Cycloclasticus sp.]|nr:MAG: transcriptional regulator [Cycloclasticus sp.]